MHHRFGYCGSGLVAMALFMQGCFTLDWDYQTTPETPGEGGKGVSSEDCTNGLDDDDDGRIDCTDSDCMSGYECRVAVPAGWTPYWLLEKPYEDKAATACPDGQDALVWYTQPATTATCSPCACSFKGATCSAPAFACSLAESECIDTMTPYKSTGTPACYTIPLPQGSSYGSCKLAGPPTPTSLGTCSGTPSMVTGPAIFGGALRLCAAPSTAGEGCVNGDVCALKKPGTFGQGRACIEQPGIVQCPDGWGAQIVAAYENGTDARQCSNCGCDTSTITCSGGDVRIYEKKVCDTYRITMNDTTQCYGAFFFEYARGMSASFTLGTPSDGSCSQATPSGVVQGTGPHTLCCRD